MALLQVTNALSDCEYSWTIAGEPAKDFLRLLHLRAYNQTVCDIHIDVDNSVVDSGVSETGSFESSQLKKVGQYSLAVSESCVDGSSRTADQTVSDDTVSFILLFYVGFDHMLCCVCAALGEICATRVEFAD